MSAESVPSTSRVIAITGGSRGIGQALAARCVAAGHRVAIGSRSGSSVDKAVQELASSGPGTVDGHVVDVTSAESNEAFFDWVTQQVGPPDVCVFNAGVGYWSPTAETSVEDWSTTVRVNVDGVFYGTRCVLPGMVSRGSGHLVYMSSVMGRRGVPNMAAYAASKAAVASFGESVAAEVKRHGVKVTVMYPGTTDTTMREHQVNRPQTPDVSDPELQLDPEDIADAIMWALRTSHRAFPTGLFMEPPAPPAQ